MSRAAVELLLERGLAFPGLSEEQIFERIKDMTERAFRAADPEFQLTHPINYGLMRETARRLAKGGAGCPG